MAQSVEYPYLEYIGPPRWYGGTRPGKPRYIVIHSTENDASARGEASYATRRSDKVSSNYYVDAAELIQSLITSLYPYHAGGNLGNPYGIGYELTGFAVWSRSRWLTSIAWDRLAFQIRADCSKYGIPMVYVNYDGLQTGKRGITTHNDCRRAWGGTTHTDPGPNFPMDHLVALVQGSSGGTDMLADERAWLAELHLLATKGLRTGAPNATPPNQNQTAGGGMPIAWWPGQFELARRQVASVLTAVQTLAQAIEEGDGSTDAVAIIAAMTVKLEELEANLNANIRDAAADLGEGGAAQVRENPDGVNA